MTFCLLIVATHPLPAFQVIVSTVPSPVPQFTFIRVSAPGCCHPGWSASLLTLLVTPLPACQISAKLDNMRLRYWRVNKFCDFLAPTSQSWLDQTIANLERYRSRGRRSQNSKTRFRFSICCFESDWKATAVKKIEAKFSDFFRGWFCEIKSIFHPRPRTQPPIYFWLSVFWLSGGWVWMEKSLTAK